jgi:hypothetical protein
MALEQMEGFELAGRAVIFFHLPSFYDLLKIISSFVSIRYMRKAPLEGHRRILSKRMVVCICHRSPIFLLILDGIGTNLNAASRQALMQKLARMDAEPSLPEMFATSADPFLSRSSLFRTRPNIPQAMTTKCVLLKNMFNPEE